MNPRVHAIEALHGTVLDLRFEGGELRRFDVRPYLERGGVFAQLREPGIFLSAKVVAGAVEWPGEIDLSYDTLYLCSVPLEDASVTVNRRAGDPV